MKYNFIKPILFLNLLAMICITPSYAMEMDTLEMEEDITDNNNNKCVNPFLIPYDENEENEPTTVDTSMTEDINTELPAPSDDNQEEVISMEELEMTPDDQAFDDTMEITEETLENQ